MSALQSSILIVKLKHLEEWTRKKRNIAYLYNQFLSGIGSIVIPHELPYVKHVYHLYVVRILNKNRDEVRRKLLEMGVQTGIHYPIPLHLQKAYKSLNYKQGMFPVAEKCAKQILSLPIHPELKNEEVEFTAERLKGILEND